MTDGVDFKQEHSGPTGWTERTIWPTMDQPYHMACCDCGLVHDIQFSVLRRARGRDFGGYRPAFSGRSRGRMIYPKRDKAVMPQRSVQVTMLVRRNEILSDRIRAKDGR